MGVERLLTLEGKFWGKIVSREVVLYCKVTKALCFSLLFEYLVRGTFKLKF